MTEQTTPTEDDALLQVAKTLKDIKGMGNIEIGENTPDTSSTDLSVTIKIGECVITSPYDSLDIVANKMCWMLKQKDVQKYLSVIKENKIKGNSYLG